MILDCPSDALLVLVISNVRMTTVIITRKSANNNSVNDFDFCYYGLQ